MHDILNRNLQYGRRSYDAFKSHHGSIGPDSSSVPDDERFRVLH